MPKKPIEPRVLYRDDHLLAVDKPAGMPTVVGRLTTIVSCRQWLADALFERDLRAVLPVHRIDRETSGLLLFALTKDAQRQLSIQFQNREVRKEYLALVRGRPVASNGLAEVAIGQDPHFPNRSKLSPKSGKPASTEYEVAEAFRGFTLMRCFPKTGRRHQIRLHMRALGCPLAVDPLYGSERTRKPRDDDEPPPIGLFVHQFKRDYKAAKHREPTPVIARLTLHAHRIGVKHPTTGDELNLECEPPKDFRAAVNQLRKWATLPTRAVGARP